MALLVGARLPTAGGLPMTLGRVRVAEYLRGIGGLALAASGALVLGGGAIVRAAPVVAVLFAVVGLHRLGGYLVGAR